MQEHKIRIRVPSIEIITPRGWFAEFPNIVERAGRVSHKSEGAIELGSAERFISKIAFQAGHESIIEHASLTVKITCSRACSHQLVRHRLCSFTQSSQRYCDYSNKNKFECFEIIIPPSLLSLDEVDYKKLDGLFLFKDDTPVWTGLGSFCDINDLAELDLFLSTAYESFLAYCSLRSACKPEDARYLLPSATMTEIFCTCNLRQWRHILKMRLNKHAQWEVRMIMKDLLDTLLNSPLQVFFSDIPLQVFGSSDEK